MTLTANVEMSRMGEFETWSTLKTYLARQLVGGRLAVVLGAGTSTHFGLPTWTTLIERLYSRHGSTPPPKRETIQAEEFKNQYHRRDQESFFSEVKDALYEGITIGFDQMMTHYTLAGVLSMLMAAGPNARTEVVTFNWDDLLERYLALHGRVAVPVFEEKHWAQTSDVTVFHPHGFLPYSTKLLPSERLVFDQYSYDEIMGSDTIWRQVLLGLYRTRTCVLIGLSGDDPNLSSLLLRVKEQHASISSQTLFWAVVFTTDKGTADRWQDRGVYPVILTDYKELPAKLFDITDAAISMRSR